MQQHPWPIWRLIHDACSVEFLDQILRASESATLPPALLPRTRVDIFVDVDCVSQEPLVKMFGHGHGFRAYYDSVVAGSMKGTFLMREQVRDLTRPVMDVLVRKS